MKEKMIDFDGLKLESKKLKSGNYQVKFYLTVSGGKSRYGYLLAEPQTSVREVVERIYESTLQLHADIHHNHLFSIGKDAQDTRIFYP